ncbi:MAG: hypothetical protein RMJ67_09050 [Elusimicrobiota bacterium]|nr:hypothetical protein [Endomicrobiia bacterium]MDW8166644.1 hypothetical protein [Elusimicrobiota bacterium]
MTIEKLIEEIITKYNAYLESKKQKYPRQCFIASDISDCDRCLIYSVLNWQDRAEVDNYLIAILEAGKEYERKVIADLLNLGFEIIEGQTPFEIKNRQGEVICRGKIDGKIKYSGNKYPFEIKTMNINMFNLINDIEDFSKKPLFRKYLRQIQLYLYGHNCEEGLFIITDLQKHYKLIPVYLDYGECELILQRLEKCWEYVKKKELPQMINDTRICQKCAFNHLCLPDIKSEGSEFIEDDELLTMLERREELKKYVEEYEEIDEIVKERLKVLTKPAFVGDKFLVEVKKTIYTQLNVKLIPDEIKKQYEEKKERIQIIIKNLEKGGTK